MHKEWHNLKVTCCSEHCFNVVVDRFVTLKSGGVVTHGPMVAALRLIAPVCVK